MLVHRSCSTPSPVSAARRCPDGHANTLTGVRFVLDTAAGLRALWHPTVPFPRRPGDRKTGVSIRPLAAPVLVRCVVSRSLTMPGMRTSGPSGTLLALGSRGGTISYIQELRSLTGHRPLIIAVAGVAIFDDRGARPPPIPSA